MSTRNYIPRADPAFDTWQANYVAYAVAHHRRLDLDDRDVSDLEDAQSAWNNGFGQLPEARSFLASVLAEKDAARRAFEGLIRKLSGQIQANPAIEDAQRAALGLTIPDPTRSPVAVPATFPVLSIDAGQRLLHRLRFVDSLSPLRRGKPAGVIALELRQCLTPAASATSPAFAGGPTDPALFVFAGLFTRSPARVTFGGDDAGKMAHYCARWINTRAEAGPWGEISSATVGG
ncbi:MAG TPA: hypothetical protein VNT79_07045 [Phycisphaerae bacterium]|nr:hypothetical protein [Phycisphaerae bacterium]